MRTFGAQPVGLSREGLACHVNRNARWSCYAHGAKAPNPADQASEGEKTRGGRTQGACPTES